MAWYVDDSDLGVEFAHRLIGSESEDDADTPVVFFFEAVGVDTGEGADQRSLAVIHVTGGTDKEMLGLTVHDRVIVL